MLLPGNKFIHIQRQKHQRLSIQSPFNWGFPQLENICQLPSVCLVCPPPQPPTHTHTSYSTLIRLKHLLLTNLHPSHTHTDVVLLAVVQILISQDRSQEHSF